MKKKQKKSKQDCLIGRFFHSIDAGGKLRWQGEVIGRVSEEYYLVKLFDTAMGEPSVQRIIALSEMSAWLFYSNADEMTNSYEHGTATPVQKETQEKLQD